MKKRKDGRYAKQINIGIKDGKPIRKTIYGKTQKELDKNYREFMSLYEKGIVLKDIKMTFFELSEQWMKNEKRPRLKDQSYNNLCSQIKNINKYIGHLKVKEIKRTHIESFKEIELKEGKIDQYNKALSSIRSILNYGISIDVVDRNITTGMKRIPYNGKRKKRCLTMEERELIEHAELDDFEYCFLNLLLYTGLRKSEALALNVNDINLKEKKITVSKTLVTSKGQAEILQDNTKTEAGVRIIPIQAPLYPILEKYCKDRVGILFLSQYNNYIGAGNFFKRWKKILRKLEEANGSPIANDITPHIFRHTYASDLYKAGISIKEAQYLLGHTDVKTTLDTYTHFGYTDIQSNKLDEYYKAVKKQSTENKKSLKSFKQSI